jgi:hypothetical protein
MLQGLALRGGIWRNRMKRQKDISLRQIYYNIFLIHLSFQKEMVFFLTQPLLKADDA